MPKTATDYSKNVIYKIQHNDDDSLLYVGHTTNFIKRKAQHKNNCGTYLFPLYKMIRENGGWECFTMIVIQNFPCENKMEARIEEDRMMREMKASMNERRAYLSPKDKTEYTKGYKQANREHICETKKEYNENNKEHISGKRKEYRQANKEPLREYKKQYRQANKEAINTKQKEYVKANKELISEKNKQPIECECGCSVRNDYLAKHKKTKKHLNNLK